MCRRGFVPYFHKLALGVPRENIAGLSTGEAQGAGWVLTRLLRFSVTLTLVEIDKSVTLAGCHFIRIFSF